MASFNWPPEGGSGGIGTVTSVGLSDGSTVPIFGITGSPVTGAGTLTFTLKTETANTVFAGPSSGSAAQPTFRSLVSADIPTLAYISTTLGATALSGGLTVSGNTLSAAQAATAQNGWLSSTDWNTFNGKQAAGNYITALTGDVTASGPGSVAATFATVNSNIGTFASVTVNAKGLVTAAAALSGDATTSSAVLTLATVNTNTGSFGSSTSIPNFTVNGKGLLTAAGGNVVIAPAGTLSGTVLNATVVTSSLTTVGTIGTGTWQGTGITVAFGGTGFATAASNGILYGAGTSALGVTAAGTTGQALVATTSSPPAWGTLGTAGVSTATFTAPTRQIFTSGTAQTYTTPTSPRTPLILKITVIGGGGGGGAGANISAGSGGGGGGAGGASIAWVTSPSSTYTYTVGGAGSAGVTGGAAAGNGGTSSFGSTIASASGGTGGVSGNGVNTAPGNGGAGGVGSSGTVNMGGGGGNPGDFGVTAVVAGSGGGGGTVSGEFGGGGGYSVSGAATVGGAGGNYGGGGGGGSAQANGGIGAVGIIVVEEFYQ